MAPEAADHGRDGVVILRPRQVDVDVAAADSSGDGEDIHRHDILSTDTISCGRLEAFLASVSSFSSSRQPAVGRDPLQVDMSSALGDGQEEYRACSSSSHISRSIYPILYTYIL